MFLRGTKHPEKLCDTNVSVTIRGMMIRSNTPPTHATGGSPTSSTGVTIGSPSSIVVRSLCFHVYASHFHRFVGRTWSMWPWMRLSRMRATSSCSTSYSGMLSCCDTKGMRMRVYGCINFNTTCTHTFASLSPSLMHGSCSDRVSRFR
jgi:hypothetical protein